MFRPLAVLAVLSSLALPALAQEKVTVAAGAQGNWETAAADLGKRSGIFARHGLDVNVLWTQGGGETQQAVVSGSADIGIGLGLGAVMSAYQKGAPLRPIANASTGPDLYWYVPAASPIRSLKDAAGKSMAYSTVGSSSYVALAALGKMYGIDVKPVATGGPAATYTQVMSGQVDIGWAGPPFGFAQQKAGQIRVVAREAELADFQNQTARVMVSSLPALEAKRALIDRFRAAYAETIEWMYASPDAMPAYAAFSGVPVDISTQVRDEFWPKKALLITSLGGVDVAMRDAVEMKFLREPLTKAQLDEFFAFYAK